MIDKRFYKYFVAIAIFSIHLRVTAQTKLDTSVTTSISFRASPRWKDAVMTHSLESATKINAIAFSLGGQLLATVSRSKITIWDIEKGEQRILPGHYSTETGMETAPTAIAFSPDSRFLATSTLSQGIFSPDSILVREIATGETVLDITDARGYGQVLFDPSGEIIYSAGDSGVTAWSFPEGDKLFSFDTQHLVEAIALSPNGRVMATVDANVSTKQASQIQLWQLNEQQPTLLNTLDGHVNKIAKLEFTADGKRLISSSYDGKIKVWDWRKGIDSNNNLYSDGGVFSLGGENHLIAGNFHSSAIADLTTGLPLKNNIAIDRQKTNLVAFSPREPRLAIVETSPEADNSVINLWLAGGFEPKLSNSKANYRPIFVPEYWSDRLENDTLAIGNPREIALSALGLREIVESERQEVELDYPSDNLTTVTITQTNLADDSVAGIRYLVHFAPYGDRNANKWQVVWAGQRFKCQPGRGSRDWSPDLCQ